jgi:hypothetical protein
LSSGPTPISFPDVYGLALRTGIWRDPDHQFNYEGDDPIVQALLRPGEDQVHFTAGFGLAFQRFQLDIGFDFSDLVDKTSFSAIFSFRTSI